MKQFRITFNDGKSTSWFDCESFKVNTPNGGFSSLEGFIKRCCTNYHCNNYQLEYREA